MTMSDENKIMPTYEPKLGVGTIISDTFSLFAKGFVLLTALGTAYNFLFSAFSNILYSKQPIIGVGFWQFTSLMIIAVIGGAFITSVLIAAAFDVKIDRQPDIRAYMKTAVSCLFPMTVFSLVFWFGVIVGAMFFTVPGLYIAAMWSVGAPLIVIEKTGFKVFSRSVALTKNYRWSVVGLLLIVVVLVFVLLTPVVMLSEGWNAFTEPQPGGTIYGTGWVGLLVQSIVAGVFCGWYTSGAVVLYMRLKEIKEGISSSQFSAVFD